ncbi:ABC transporter substrate-binding protein [Bosea sp. NBC_00550]|uniref:ABC transporter substrate-binding protein n=1 Tax=Bosea sp. NBC_00550 TaxID=2969621 RepID=UPI002231A85A|nr:ABC transporter substrate-binding protein [Bosea sp. NBC_00550]UZF92988.1 ABC transporter substrate-binding protein [Bosea sp. NBC_00550]
MIDRRTLLALAAGTVAGIGQGFAQSTTLRIGYVPVIGASALFVVAGDGSARDAGLDLKLSKFDSGPNAIQAFASGTIDILVIGVAPVAVARARGLDTAIITAAAVGGAAFMAGPTLAKAFAENGNDPAKAFAAFNAATGRKAKLGTLPPGGVPTVALHHWLWKVGKVERSDVEIANMGIEGVQQAMLTGAIDGGTLLEPSVTVVSERDPRIKRIVNSPDMFPNIPGVVVAASGDLLKNRPDLAERFVGLFHRATEQIRSEPAKAAPLVLAVLGGGLVEEGTIARALTSPAVSFVNDPGRIRGATEELLAYQVELGDFPQAPALDGLFDQALYERGVRTAAR